MLNSSLLESARVWWLNAHKLLYRSNEVHLFWSKRNTTSESSNLRGDHRGEETLECGKETGWDSSAGVKNVPCPVCCVGRIHAKMWEDLLCVRLIYLKTACYCRHRVQVPLFKWDRCVTRMTVLYFRPTAVVMVVEWLPSEHRQWRLPAIDSKISYWQENTGCVGKLKAEGKTVNYHFTDEACMRSGNWVYWRKSRLSDYLDWLWYQVMQQSSASLMVEKNPNLLYWKGNLNQQKQDVGIIELLSAVSRDFLLLRPAGFNHFK